MSKQPEIVLANFKLCTKCTETKPVSEFYTSRQTKDGLHGWCKKCCKDAQRERNRHSETCECNTCQRARAAEIGLVYCPGCKKLKRRDEFYAHPQTKNGLNTDCKECCSETQKARYVHVDDCDCQSCLRNAANALGLKRCPCCERALPLDEFSKKPGSKDGLRVYCITCEREKSSENRGQHDAGCDCAVCTRELKCCSRCRIEKPRDEFQSNASNADGLQYNCRRCCRFIARQQKYGLTEADFWEMYNAQGGNCASCDRGFTEEFLMVDHDHECCPGQRSCGTCVRALLCRECNTSLGLLHDDPIRIVALANYILRHKDVLHPSVDLLSTFS